jgi:hypothetical protein
MSELPEDASPDGADASESLIRVETAGFVSFFEGAADCAAASMAPPAATAASARPDTEWRKKSETRIAIAARRGR